MAKKIRELKEMLRKAGFISRTAKGSHSFWQHPSVPGIGVAMCGKDGEDAKRYLEKKVERAIKNAGGYP